ncbi:hypothetical protein KVR01_006153 [Diaporthe batatas]|uniref:uncharacterized protein n=1 Tax=Diaporthe batatas TaxID=748121 RepID=UPI001D04D33A|nr:uncharacterized protein KVR01_006153 [Diaporthe batatas]KAG8164235.1 hypothetical protein KVR01_006153 [Diaporthe batatas]
MLASWGVAPAAVVGHSSGEIAAAYAAGLLSARQAILVAYFRGVAVGTLRGEGAMMAAGLGPEAAGQLIRDSGLGDEVCVACVNSPESTTLSGSAAGIELLMASLQEQGRFARVLQTGGRAYHSAMMKQVGALYENLLAPHLVGGPEVSAAVASSSNGTGRRAQMFSSVGFDGDRVARADSATVTSTEYWRNNLERPVQFWGAVQNMLASSAGSGGKGEQGRRGRSGLHLVEVGPHSALKGPLQQIRKHMGWEEAAAPYSCALVRGQDADLSAKKLAGLLFLQGVGLSWQHVNDNFNINITSRGHRGPQLAHLPPYPWDYSGGLVWVEPRASIETRNRPFPRHPLLGSLRVAGSDLDWHWKNQLSLKEVPWLRDHKIETQVVFPAAGYLAVGIEALSQVLHLRSVASDKDRPKNDSNQTRRGNSASGRPLWFEFRNVSINAALVVADDEDKKGSQGTEQAELHTAMSPRALSSTTTSADWYDFSISSWAGGKTRVHCAGGVRGHQAELDFSADTVKVGPDQDHDLQERISGQGLASAASYYQKFEHEGLCLGPQFQSVSGIVSPGDDREVLATTLLRPQKFDTNTQLSPDEVGQDAVHTITIDACIQAGIMSTAAGDMSALGAHVPVSIRECWVRGNCGESSTAGGDKTRATAAATAEAQGTIDARARKTGLSTHRVDATLRDPHSATPLVHLQDVLVSHYAAKVAPAATGAAALLPRQPCLRVAWKPDVGHLRAGSGEALRGYLAGFVDHLPQRLPDTGLPETACDAAVAALLDLAGHRNPRMRVLQLGDECGCRAAEWTAVLDKGTAAQRYQSWKTMNLGPADGNTDHIEGAPNGGDGGDDNDDDHASEHVFDVVLLTSRKQGREYWAKHPTDILSRVARGGIVITRQTAVSAEVLRKAGFRVVEMGNGLICGVRPEDSPAGLLEGKRFVILTRKALPCPLSEIFAEAIATQLQDQAGACSVEVVPLENAPQTSLTKDTICISLVEVADKFLATMGQEDMDRLRSVTGRVKTLLWLTGADTLGSKPRPDLALCNGLSRAVMLEQPALRFVVMDVGAAPQWMLPSTRENIVSVLAGSVGHADRADSEFVQHDGLVYISRFTPDTVLNTTFNNRMHLGNPETSAQQGDHIRLTPLAEARPAQLAIGRVGVSETIHFQAKDQPQVQGEGPPAGSIDVLIKAISLNAKNVYALNGRLETQAASNADELSGIVTAVGPGVTTPRPGDRVFGCAPGQLATTMRMRATDAHVMLDAESFTVMPTLLTVYMTALYAFGPRANLRAGETVLIHGGAGALGWAAITIARRLGAVVYTTAGSAAKRRFITGELGIPAERVFGSRDAGFVEGLRRATGGRMADVVVNFLVGDLLHESWRCVGPYGRFVEVGKRDLIEGGRLDMDVFLRGATFTAFDLHDLMMLDDEHHRQVWDRLGSDVVRLYRAGEIKAPPIKTFDVSDVVQAYRFFSTPDRVGKVVISFENESSLILLAPRKYTATLDPNKTYLLIGCLGGLGRSLSRWLLSRGARNFVFLGRTGADKKSARDMVRRLEASGATVAVVRGDVTDRAHVEAAVGACIATGKPVGGVVQAAMGLDEGLFASMTSGAWHTGIQPKVKGTWNLHEVLEEAAASGHASLDFFLLMSSVSGSVGTATESNYCAANCFLDAFANWRRSQGKTAVSLGLGMISEVGYLHENPEIEALLLRRGIQPLTEAEFLQTIDLALSGTAGQVSGQQPRGPWADTAHILTGLEPLGVLRLQDQGFDVTHASMDDPRASVLFAALSAEQEARNKTRDRGHGAGTNGAGSNSARAAWFSSLPATVRKALQAEAHAPTMQVAVLNLLRRRFSSLILVSPDKVEDDRSLANFGVDSMIASEFRTWIWAAFKVDIPFLDILSHERTLGTLAASVADELGRA